MLRTLHEIRAEARAAGYTHVQTYGGPVPLADWDPYGLSPGGVNNRKGTYRQWAGTFCPEEECIRDRPATEGFYSGRWPLLREVPAHAHD